MNKRILVAMSGGVDSSVAAALLHKKGYDLIGVTMKTWDYASSGSKKKETGCCSLDSINDARSVAVHFGFPHYIIDLRDEFGDHVINNFVDEYLAGRTPNPCIRCNTYIKWEALMRRANQLNCDYIATGHYAKLKEANNRYYISEGKDLRKDQSYVLWGVSQECLSRTIFPVSDFEKPEIKQLAIDFGFDYLSKKGESYEICFIPDNNYRDFLDFQAPERMNKLKDGTFVLKDGKEVGTHDGFPFFTIGQRKGLVAMGEPYYVTEIIPSENKVVIGKKDELYKKRFTIRGLNMVKYNHLSESPTEVEIKIRYNSFKSSGSIIAIEDDKVMLEYHHSVNAITPGQAAVIYEGPDVVAGGWIDQIFE